MNPIEPITLAVLAGGESVRMGQPKSSLRIHQVPILERLLKHLSWPGPTLLVTAPSNAHPPGAQGFDREATDPHDAGGPLQGLLTALQNCSTHRLIMIPVDMPSLTRAQLLEFAEKSPQNALCARVLTQSHENLIEPFPGSFTRDLIAPVQGLLSENRRSMHGMVKLGLCQTFDATHWHAATWTNLNTPEDLALFERDNPV